MTVTNSSFPTRGSANPMTQATTGLEALFLDLQAQITALSLSGITAENLFYAETQSSAVDVAKTAQPNVLKFTMTASGKYVRLGSCTAEATLYDGGVYWIWNAGSYAFDVQDYGGTVITDVQPGEILSLNCISDATAAGQWKVNGRPSLTPYALQLGGATASAKQQSIASLGITGQVLKSNGSGAAPSFGNALTVTEATASFTLALTAIDTLYKLNHASTAIVVTVPANADVAFEIGAQIAFERYGAAACSFVAGSGVTIHKASWAGLEILDQYTAAALVKTGTNEWLLMGNV